MPRGAGRSARAGLAPDRFSSRHAACPRAPARRYWHPFVLLFAGISNPA